MFIQHRFQKSRCQCRHGEKLWLQLKFANVKKWFSIFLLLFLAIKSQQEMRAKIEVRSISMRIKVWRSSKISYRQSLADKSKIAAIRRISGKTTWKFFIKKNYHKCVKKSTKIDIQMFCLRFKITDQLVPITYFRGSTCARCKSAKVKIISAIKFWNVCFFGRSISNI